jgi:mono/diheme cytochrome c family protein
VLLFSIPSVAFSANQPAGRATYQSHCASCHDNPAATQAPSKSALEILSRASIVLSLESGAMKDQGKS